MVTFIFDNKCNFALFEVVAHLHVLFVLSVSSYHSRSLNVQSFSHSAFDTTHHDQLHIFFQPKPLTFPHANFAHAKSTPTSFFSNAMVDQQYTRKALQTLVTSTLRLEILCSDINIFH